MCLPARLVASPPKNPQFNNAVLGKVAEHFLSKRGLYTACTYDAAVALGEKECTMYVNGYTLF
jgi:hypothetical protein